MKKMLIFAGAAAFALVAPASAKPAHANHAKGHAGHGQMYGTNGPIGYGVGGCPPGLAKKNNGCLPPGQAKKLYNVGQRYPYQTQSLFGYNQLPQQYRTGGMYDPYGRYAYDNGYYYRVDPTTMVIQQILGTLVR